MPPTVSSSAAVANNEPQQQPQGRSWKQTIIQIILFQLVMRFFSPRPPAQQMKDPITGEVIPPLQNSLLENSRYDLFFHISSNSSSLLQDFHQNQNQEMLVWFLPDQVYNYDRKLRDRKTAETLFYYPPAKLFDTIINQHLLKPSEAGAGEKEGGALSSSLNAKTGAESFASEGAAFPSLDVEEGSSRDAAAGDGNGGGGGGQQLSAVGAVGGLLERLSGVGKLRSEAAKRKGYASLYLIVSAIPHFVYGHIPAPFTLQEALELLKSQSLWPSFDSRLIIRSSVLNLVEYMKPATGEEGINLLNPTAKERSLQQQQQHEEGAKQIAEEPHWKSHIDVRMVYDRTPITPQSHQVLHYKQYIHLLPDRGLYHPILVASDLWLLEHNFVHLNATLLDKPLNLTLSFNTLNSMWWAVQSHLIQLWTPIHILNEQQTSDAAAVPGSPAAFAGDSNNSRVGRFQNPLLALQYNHGRRETFMIKRIILETSPWLLGFSAVFMISHSVLSVLAFKNDISFWNRNESMEGLSALSVIFSFCCEIIVALYLYDSDETSFLILFEIFLGVAISAWKVTKVVSISLTVPEACLLPRLRFQDKKDYKESETKAYDATAIRFMSLALLPCCVGYSVYCLKTKKYRSWWSFVISSLAGTVYTFGFVLMTPQLYINYKLKSVDHLPWRVFTYKAMNTFIDDIAAFIIDMPLMHRLACFRDDVVFICYLYQRWIYRVDKTRPTSWTDASVTPADADAAPAAAADGPAAIESVTPGGEEEEADLTGEEDEADLTGEEEAAGGEQEGETCETEPSMGEVEEEAQQQQQKSSKIEEGLRRRKVKPEEKPEN